MLCKTLVVTVFDWKWSNPGILLCSRELCSSHIQGFWEELLIARVYFWFYQYGVWWAGIQERSVPPESISSHLQQGEECNSVFYRDLPFPNILREKEKVMIRVTLEMFHLPDLPLISHLDMHKRHLNSCLLQMLTNLMMVIWASLVVLLFLGSEKRGQK